MIDKPQSRVEEGNKFFGVDGSREIVNDRNGGVRRKVRVPHSPTGPT
jgi:hypothetical protein